MAFFRGFDLTRPGQFCVYFPVFPLFFILNNSRIIAPSRCSATYIEGPRGFRGARWRNALMMVGGILIIVLVEYIPFFLNIGRGCSLRLHIRRPLHVASDSLCASGCRVQPHRNICIQKDWIGNTGALRIASMACRIVTGGSSMM